MPLIIIFYAIFLVGVCFILVDNKPIEQSQKTAETLALDDTSSQKIKIETIKIKGMVKNTFEGKCSCGIINSSFDDICLYGEFVDLDGQRLGAPKHFSHIVRENGKLKVNDKDSEIFINCIKQRRRNEKRTF